MLAIFMASHLVIAIDIWIVFTGLPKIQAGLRLSPAGPPWEQSTYTLVFGGLLLQGARAGDILG